LPIRVQTGKHVKLTQLAKALPNFSALHSQCGADIFTTNLVFFNEKIIQNIWGETEEAIATLKRNDEGIC